MYRIGPGGRFDLDTWRGSGGIAYTLSAEAGVLVSSRGEIYCRTFLRSLAQYRGSR